jgi:hypothetical protein
MIKIIELQGDDENHMYAQTNKSTRQRVSEYLSIAAMALLLIYVADAAVARGETGFLPMSEAQRGMIFGTSSIVLFFAAFAVALKERRSKLTAGLLIAGGALMGTTVLGAIMMAGGFGAVSPTFHAVMVLGYVIMGLGIALVLKSRRRKTSP